MALAAAEQIYSCREELAAFLGLSAPERILFTLNTTHALNFAIKGLLKDGDHVLISELEHNAVRRPLHRMMAEKSVTVDVFPVLGLTCEQIIAGIAERFKPATKVVICTHASNVCSAVLPIASIGSLCHEKGIFFIVDGAQSAGVYPIHMKKMHMDALAIPAHKSLYGIQGCGVLALGERISLDPLLEGGSGVDSLSTEMPADPPERFEAGTLPTPAIVGLLEGVRSLRNGMVEQIAARERSLFLAARERLSSLGMQIYAPEYEGAVLLFNAPNVLSTELGRYLSSCGICVRSGLHCAPMAHRALGTPEGGAVRISFGRYNTLADIDALWRVLKNM